MIPGELKDLVEYAVRRALGMNVDYAEARYQINRSTSLFMINGNIEALSNVSVAGISIRVIVNGSMGFASTNDPKNVDKAVESAIKGAKACLKISKELRLSEESFGEASYTSKVLKRPEDISPEEKIELLSSVDELAKEKGITSRNLSLRNSREQVYYVNSEGSRVEGDVTRVSGNATLTLVMGAESTQEFVEKGGSGGWELVEGWNFLEEVSRIADVMKECLEKGISPPRGKMDLVLGPYVVGLMMHESTGHPYEADRILGREAAQAGESFVKPDMLGTRIGSEVVTVVDDPTIEGSSGFYLYDMEGVKARRRILMKNGIINEFLHNRETAAIFGVKSNAAARASSYDREPIIRMANTFMLPGDYSQDELIEGIKEGVFIARFTEWNIDDRRYNQRYVGSEAYLIKDGKLDKMVKRPILEITTPAFYSSIDAVGKDLKFTPGLCGKSDPGQAVPVWFGGPSVRLRGVRLGGI
ncbi:MAG: TldD/PmbA family protein [Thermoproteota archaeon]|nr:MAG: TldD/PmbA family protein [Candidatus Korarchaeota archaeon]